jgi:hypothetical protein
VATAAGTRPARPTTPLATATTTSVASSYRESVSSLTATSLSDTQTSSTATALRPQAQVRPCSEVVPPSGDEGVYEWTIGICRASAGALEWLQAR